MIIVNSQTSDMVIFNGVQTTGILNGSVIWGTGSGPTYTGTSQINLGFSDDNFYWRIAVNRVFPDHPNSYYNVNKNAGISLITASSQASAILYVSASAQYASFNEPPIGLGSAVLVGWGISGNIVTATYSGILSDAGWSMESGVKTGKKCVKILSMLKTNTTPVASSYAPWYFVPNNRGTAFAMLDGASATSFISSDSEPYRFIGSGIGMNYISSNTSFGYESYTTESGSGGVPVSGRPRLCFYSAHDIEFSGSLYAKWNSGSSAPSGSMGFTDETYRQFFNSASGLPYNQPFTGSSKDWSIDMTGSMKYTGAWSSTYMLPACKFEQKTGSWPVSIAISSHSGQWSASANVR